MDENVTNNKCKKESLVAEIVMEIRQNNKMTAIEVIERYKKNKFFQDLVIRAYSIPNWNIEKNRNETIINFKNEIFLECMKREKKV